MATLPLLIYTKRKTELTFSSGRKIFHGGISKYAAAWGRAETADMAVIVIHS